MTDEVFFEMFIKEPYEKGHKDGKEEGIILGKEEGIILGKEEGKEENKIENAISLLKNGVSIEIITKSLKLTKIDLKLINEKMKK